MLVNTQVSAREKKRWIRSHIYKVYYFRLSFNKEQKAPSPVERKKMAQKRERLYKKVEEHMKYGETLHFDEKEMKSLNLSIVQMVQKGKVPKEIIKEFKEKSQI